MSSERIRIEIDDAELDEMIAKMDEAIRKKTMLTEPLESPERVEEEVKLLEAEIPAETKTSIDQYFEQMRTEADIVQEEVETITLESLSKLESVEDVAQLSRLYVDETVNRLTESITQESEFVDVKVEGVMIESLTKLGTVEDLAKTVELYVDETVDRISQEIIIADSLRIRFADSIGALDLPSIDRASRMILLRIPGLREAMRLLYVIKMQQRTLKLGEIRGPVTFAITMAMYGYMFLQSLIRRQDQMEAHIRKVEQDMDVRMITLEEAVRGYGVLPEKYRSDIPMV